MSKEPEKKIDHIPSKKVSRESNKKRKVEEKEVTKSQVERNVQEQETAAKAQEKPYHPISVTTESDPTGANFFFQTERDISPSFAGSRNVSFPNSPK